METKEYSEIIAKTAIYPKKVDNFGVAYAFLGMFDEMQEVEEKLMFGEESEAHTERFDVVWYMCALCQEVGISFTDMTNYYFINREDEEKVNDWIMSEDLYFGKIKKFYRDGKVIDNEHMMMSFFMPFMHELFAGYDRARFEQGLQENYEKLMARRERGTIKGDGDKR